MSKREAAAKAREQWEMDVQASMSPARPEPPGGDLEQDTQDTGFLNRMNSMLQRRGGDGRELSAITSGRDRAKAIIEQAGGLTESSISYSCQHYTCVLRT